MNGKRAKALRRAAQQQTVGAEAVAYVATKQRKRIAEGRQVTTSSGRKQVLLRTETVKLDPNCTRAAYQRLKKEAT